MGHFENTQLRLKSWNLDGTTGGVDVDSLPFLNSCSPVIYPNAVAPTIFLYPFSYPLNAEACHVGPGGVRPLMKSWSASEVLNIELIGKMTNTKFGSDQIHLIPKFSEVERDASRKSHGLLRLCQQKNVSVEFKSIKTMQSTEHSNITEVAK